MAKFKLIISDPTTGKSAVSEIEGSRAHALVGRSLGETIDGSALGIGQGRFLISGGCDRNGIPMRADVHGGVKKYVVLSSGPGFRPKEHGERRRKLVRGRIITDETYQINFTSLREGEVKEVLQQAEMPAERKVEKARGPALKKPSGKKVTRRTRKGAKG